MKKLLAIVLLCCASTLTFAQTAAPQGSTRSGWSAWSSNCKRALQREHHARRQAHPGTGGGRHADGRRISTKSIRRRPATSRCRRSRHSCRNARPRTERRDIAGAFAWTPLNRIIVLDDEAELRNMLQRFLPVTVSTCARPKTANV